MRRNTTFTETVTRDATTTYRGVELRPNGAYRAYYSDGGNVVVGTYTTLEEAATAHDRAVRARFGATAVCNFLADGKLNPFRFTMRRNTTFTKKPKTTLTKTRDVTSIYRGVSYEEDKRRYRAEVYDGGRRVYRASFRTEREAALAYDSYVKQHKPGWTILNFSSDGSSNQSRHSTERRFTDEEQVKEKAVGKPTRGKPGRETTEMQRASKARRLDDGAINHLTDEPRPCRHTSGQPRLSTSVVGRPRLEASNMDVRTVLSILKPKAFMEGEEFQALWRELEKLSESVFDATISLNGPDEPPQQYLYSFLMDTVCEAYTEQQLQTQDLKEMVLGAAKWTVDQAIGTGNHDKR